MIVSGQQVERLLKVQQTTYVKKRMDRIATGNKTDIFELSNYAQELKTATDLVLKSTEVRADKIDELKKQIKNGTYQISGTDIAAKMIDRSLVDELARR
ncbi:MAG TPA: flagellar biosynthesis anti-sigma factor FlgM [Bacillota bacterium]|nr:flagellar biosynthesis anti-sigma factor FlgM [Bacillota bacterium]